jgi:hypothetical protein
VSVVFDPVTKVISLEEEEELAKEEEYGIPPLGMKHTVVNWVREGDDPDAPFIEMVRYQKALERLPDKVVENLEKGRLAHDGKYPMLMAGLGYEDCLATAIVDGTAIASSSSEARLAPAITFPLNYLQPGGIPGRTIRIRSRGRVTTLTTAATMTFRFRIAPTDVITGTVIMASGAIVADTTAQTNTMWNIDAHSVSRAVGAAGAVLGMGIVDYAPAALTVAQQQNRFMGSAGSATPATATWDMTADQYFEFTGQWSLATAYSIQSHQYIVEALN